MLGPYGCPWPTFAAVLVAGAAVLAAVVWAVFVRLKD